jgi:hypothetical protein
VIINGRAEKPPLKKSLITLEKLDPIYLFKKGQLTLSTHHNGNSWLKHNHNIFEKYIATNKYVVSYFTFSFFSIFVTFKR